MRNTSAFVIFTFVIKLAMVVGSFFATLYTARGAFDLFYVSAHSPIVAQMFYFILAVMVLLFAIGWVMALAFSLIFFFIPSSE